MLDISFSFWEEKGGARQAWSTTKYVAYGSTSAVAKTGAITEYTANSSAAVNTRRYNR
jgi:hypothetical protein